jgi:tetratricopeptide (TPR) repeat protein
MSRASSFSSLLPWAALVILVVAIIALGYWLSKKSSFRLTELRNRFARSASTSFVGRDAEQKQFLDVSKIDKSGQPPPLWLLLMGGKGLGKRSLLCRYRERALTEKPPVVCGPVIDLAEQQPIDEFLENIARDLSEQCPGTFSDFTSKLRKYRAVAAGRKTGAERAVEITHGLAKGAAAVAGIAGVPGATLAKGALESQTAGSIVEMAKESVAGTGDRQSLMEAFAKDLGALANSQTVHRVVLLFNDLDSRPEDSDIRLLRKEFFPEVAKATSVLFVGSVEDQQRVSFIESDRRKIQVIKPFDEAESKKYVREVIGLDNAGLVDEVAKRSNGSPQKLAYYRAYFDARPAARALEHLSADAEAWVVSGEVNQLLQQVANEYLRKVIVSSSPLRWFNVELLQSTAGKANISVEKDEVRPQPTALLDPASRPSWIVQVGGGWGIETEQRRRDLVEELRRFSPTLHDEVHRIGASYHVRRVLMLEGSLDDVGDSDKQNVFDYRRKPLTTQRLEDMAYVRSVREWLYHLMALAPEKAFSNVADTVAEMLFYDFEGGSRTDASNVEQLLAIGPELDLPKRQRLYIELLTRAAFALRQQDHSESINALRALAAAGAPTPFVKPVIAFLTGACYWRLGLEQEALVCFEKADAGLAELSSDLRAVRVRGLNATWLAYTRVRRDRATASAITLLDQSIVEARDKLQDVSVVAELERVKALIMEEVGDLDNAKASYERALKNFEDAGLPEGTASVRRDLSRVLSSSGDDEGAAQELDSASSIYRSLGDNSSHAAVAIEKMALYLKQGDRVKAEEQKAIVLQPETDSASTRNQIGNAYFGAQLFEEARSTYADVVKSAPNVAIYRANLAGALDKLGQLTEAAKEIELARQLNPNDQALLLQHARLLQRVDAKAADLLFDKLQEQYENTIGENPQRAEAYGVLAELLFAWGKYEDSEKACREAIARDEKESYYHHQLGVSLDKLDRCEEAAKAFIMATKLAPGRSYIRTWIPYEAGRLTPEKGMAILDEALKEFPKDAELHFQRGKTLMKLAETVDERPSTVAVPADLSSAALVASGDGHSSGATLEAEQIAAAANVTLTDREKTLITGRSEAATLPATPTVFPDVRSRATPGEAVDLKRQRRDEALKEFETARDLEPKHVPYLLELAEVWIERQDWTKAETFAKSAAEHLQQTPQDPSAPKAQAILKRIQRKQSWNREIGNVAWDVTRIGVEVGASLADWVGESEAGRQFLNEMMQLLREGLQRQTGVTFPAVRFRLNSELGPNDCLINLHEVPRYFYTMQQEYVARESPDKCRSMGIEGTTAPLPWANAEGTWVTAADAERLRARGIESWDPRGYCALYLMHIIRLHAADFMTVEDAKALLAARSLSDKIPTESLSRFALALRRLLQEGIPITDLATICDGFSKAPETGDIIQVVEAIRRRVLPAHLAELEKEGSVRAGVLSAAFEERYFGAKGRIERRGRRSYLRMRPDDVQDFLSALRGEIQKQPVSALIVSSAERRRYIHTLVELEFPRVNIFSELELGPGNKFERVFVLN